MLHYECNVMNLFSFRQCFFVFFGWVLDFPCTRQTWLHQCEKRVVPWAVSVQIRWCGAILVVILNQNSICNRTCLDTLLSLNQMQCNFCAITWHWCTHRDCSKIKKHLSLMWSVASFCKLHVLFQQLQINMKILQIYYIGDTVYLISHTLAFINYLYFSTQRQAQSGFKLLADFLNMRQESFYSQILQLKSRGLM